MFNGHTAVKESNASSVVLMNMNKVYNSVICKEYTSVAQYKETSHPNLFLHLSLVPLKGTPQILIEQTREHMYILIEQSNHVTLIEQSNRTLKVNWHTVILASFF